MSRFLISFFYLTGILFIQPALAQVDVVPKYIYVLHGGVDSVWGQYMFMVQNQGEAEAAGTFKVVLPVETVDWQAQDGFNGNQFKLGKDGGLEFSKTFKPGDNVHTVGFKAPAEGGESILTFKMPIDVNEMSIMTRSDIKVEAEGVEVQKRTDNQKYDKYHFFNLSKGDTLSVKITGITEGRASYWKYGWIAGGVIFLTCFGLAYFTRPQQLAD